MFWKFGFHDTSTIDALLDKAEVSLEAILDEDNILQECKAQNTRLIDYFSRVDVLQQLFGYVSGNIEAEGLSKHKFPYVATEVLCSEIWSIVEVCLNNRDRLLAPFWDTVLDRTITDTKEHNIVAAHFAKINATFLMKKPHEMLSFIQSQPNVVERMLLHIETPAIVDLLVRIIQLDEYVSGTGVLEWLSAERLIPQLVELLSPFHPASMHAVVSELVKGIISMATASPGAGITDGLQNGPASNLFARQLAKRENIERLVGFVLDDFSFELELLEAKKEMTNGSDPEDRGPFSTPPHPSSPPIPNLDTATSSCTQAISIIIELIRKNNSDYFEPYLFHTIRNRLIQTQQHLHLQSDEGRESLEQAFHEMVDRMGVVHLGPLLDIMCDRLESFQQLLHKPRSPSETIPTTLGPLVPLTFERYRICELYAELLHCSNMALLNRPPEYDNLYDEEGRLKGGLSAMEDLARVIAIGSGSDDQGDMDADVDEMEPAQELPVHSTDLSSLDYSDGDEDMSAGDGDTSSDEDRMEEVNMSDDAHVASPPPVSPCEDDSWAIRLALAAPSPPVPIRRPSSSEGTRRESTMVQSNGHSPSLTNSDRSSIVSRPASTSSRRIKRSGLLDSNGHLPIGDKLKDRFAETRVLSTILDLFFSFPWNNFLHGVVYDVLHQILTGRVDHGRNRELTIALFRDARLLSRIIEAQKKNDADSSKPGHVRLGYMGHLTLISDDVIGALEHYPPDLKLLLNQFAPQPDWEDYVSGRYHETKVKDSNLLGGGKPVVTSNEVRGATKWKVDEAEIGPSPLSGENGVELGCPPESTSQLKGEFRRSGRLTREPSADFGVAPVSHDEEEDNGPPQFASYLAQAMSTHITSSDDGSDEDDEDGGWLAQKFDISDPPITARDHSSDRRPLDPGGFEDAFTPRNTTLTSTGANIFDDNFTFEDDAFGPFSDAAAASHSDPFSSITTGTDDVDDPPFDNFGEFGEFQTGDGEITPTGGSWSFASDASISSGSDDAEVIDVTLSPRESRTDAHM